MFGVHYKDPFDFEFVLRKVTRAPTDSTRPADMARKDEMRARLPVVKRAYEEANMREPIGDEPPCFEALECQGRKIAGDGGQGFTLKAFFFPAEEELAARTKAWPTKQRKCILCMRHMIHMTLMNIRARRCAVNEDTLIQNYRNIAGLQGEYELEDMDMSRENHFEGMTDPVVMHRAPYYRYVKKDGVSHYDQQLQYPKATGEQDFH